MHRCVTSLFVGFPGRLYHVLARCSLWLATKWCFCVQMHAVYSTGFMHPVVGPTMLAHCCMLQEGLPFLLPHVTKQRVDDFLRLLVENNLPLPASAGFPQAAADAGGDADQQQQQPPKPPASGQALLETPEVLQQLESVALGGAVAVLEAIDAARLGLATEDSASGALTANAPLAIAVWRTPASLSVLVSKTECEQLADKVKKAMERSKQHQEQQQQEQPAPEAMVVG